MTLSVIVVTLNRPQELRRCLQCLCDQVPRPEQVIVVDASEDDLSRVVADDFRTCGVLYLRNENGYGRMTRSRNIGLHRATGEIIAFLDDDAFAHAGWRTNLMATYGDDKTIGAVGGRALNNQAGESSEGVDEIGKLKSDGTLSGFFAADPGRTLEVDHVMGCNMSFRREVLAKLGGFREDYPGISGVREDSDMCLRVREIGYRIVFNPRAVVDHLGAPQATGQRFDVRYSFYSQRNHIVLLWRNFGPKSPIFSRYLLSGARSTLLDSLKRIASGVVRLGAFLGGTAVGAASGYRIVSRTGRSPLRNDEEGRKLREILSQSASQTPSREEA